MNTLVIVILLVLVKFNSHAQNVGDPAPDFTFTSTNDEEISLSDYTGNVVFLFLLGDKCPFCEAVGPTTESEFYQKYKKEYDDFVALGLDLWDGSKSSVESFKVKTGITYPVLLKASSMASLYSTSYDRAIIIDRKGIIQYKGASRVSNEVSQVDNKLAEVLADEDIVMDIENGEQQSYFLSDIYPNPVSEQGKLVFQIPDKGYVTLNVFNSVGQRILTPVNGYLSPGEHEVTIQASDLESGIYFYRLDVNGILKLKRFVVK